MTKIILKSDTMPDGFDLLCQRLNVKDYRFDKNLIEHFENLPAEFNAFIDYKRLKQLCLSDPNRIFNIEFGYYKNKDDNGIRFAGWSTKSQTVTYLKIAEYDESVPHMIVSENGIESIKKAELRQIDETHNLWSI